MNKMKIPFSKVDCSGNELQYLKEVLSSGWLTTAGKCCMLENAFKVRLGVRFCLAVNSCTSALHLALDALNIRQGNKVLVPTMTFTATAEVIRYMDAHPVFLDIEYGSCLITPEILADAIRKHPDAKALVLVHFGGQGALMTGSAVHRDQQGDYDVSGILDVCAANNITLIEDAAHAFPSRFAGRMIGSFGDATCFSFYANKTVTTGEGGLLATNSEDVYNRAKVMRLHGIDRDVWNRFTDRSADWEYDVIAPGYKYNMPDIAAAIGLAQLERADKFRDERERCALYYYRELSDIECIDLPVSHVNYSDHAWHLFWIVLNEKAPVSRNEFIKLMNNEGIGVSVHYKPLHRMTYYKNRYKLDERSFPQAERHWKGAVSLPIYPGLSDEGLHYVCGAIKRILISQL